MVYLAAPLFNPQELSFNSIIGELLSTRFRVYMPQRDGVLIPGNVSDEVQFKSLSRMAYDSDLDAIRQSDIVFAVLDGRVIDEGVAFELGFGVGLGKKCVGLLTDKRVLLPHGVNPMITGGLSAVLSSLEDVRDWMRAEVH